MNQADFWNKFEKTGDIRDYLYYRGVAACDQVLNPDIRTGDEYRERDCEGNGYRVICNAYGRV